MSFQISAYSTPLRRSTIWYRKVAIELLAGASVVNAWVQMLVQSEEMSVSVEIEQKAGGIPEPPAVAEPAAAVRYGDCIPRNFSIDYGKFSKALKYILELKGSLSSSLQNHLMNCLRMNGPVHILPGANGYRIVARALLDKYPHLDSAMDMGKRPLVLVSKDFDQNQKCSQAK